MEGVTFLLHIHLHLRSH